MAQVGGGGKNDDLPVEFFNSVGKERKRKKFGRKDNEFSLGYVGFEGPAGDPRRTDQLLAGCMSLALGERVWAGA